MTDAEKLQSFKEIETPNDKMNRIYEGFLENNTAINKRFEAGNEKFVKVFKFISLVKYSTVIITCLLVGTGIVEYKTVGGFIARLIW